MQLHDLQPKTRRLKPKRVGRGGKRGTYSGRGGKGQTARAGHRIRPEMRDIIKKLPKKRGHGKHRARSVNDSRTKAVPVSLVTLARSFADGAAITAAALREKGLISVRGRTARVKILGKGAITKRFAVSGVRISKGAREAIEKAGGTVA
ncbi:MAG: uL15 family ribosomal protein [Parcubacteria group bacterium]|nr:uL15 family ribosomal protein [Parcubacteria group bacterium]